MTPFSFFWRKREKRQRDTINCNIHTVEMSKTFICYLVFIYIVIYHYFSPPTEMRCNFLKKSFSVKKKLHLKQKYEFPFHIMSGIFYWIITLDEARLLYYYYLFLSVTAWKAGCSAFFFLFHNCLKQKSYLNYPCKT